MKFALINKMTTKPGKRGEVIKIMLESGAAFNDKDNVYQKPNQPMYICIC